MRSTGKPVTTEMVWREIEHRSFAVLSYVTPAGHPRASGVLYGVADDAVYVVTGATSWKSRHITDGGEVAITVPVRRGGLLALMAPIPPATISLHASVVRHPSGALPVASLPRRMVKQLPPDRRDDVTVLELHPTGQFLTYGIGVPLLAMRDPARSIARVPVTRSHTLQAAAEP